MMVCVKTMELGYIIPALKNQALEDIMNSHERELCGDRIYK